MNLMIYVLTRDSKLLQLRDKLEENQSVFAWKRVDFLFKLCVKHQIDIDQALTRLQKIEPEVYLTLNKQAKELGLRQTQTLKLFEDVNLSQVRELKSMSSSQLTATIQSNINLFRQGVYLCPEIAIKSFTVIKEYLLHQNKSWNTQKLALPKLYLLEQNFIEQVKYLQVNDEDNDDTDQNAFPQLQFLKAFQLIDATLLAALGHSDQNIKLAWLHSLISLFEFEINQITRTSELSHQANPTQQELKSQRAQTVIRNLKCLVVQLLLEVLSICQQKSSLLAKNNDLSDGRHTKTDKLNIDYSRQFGGAWLHGEGLAFEQRIVEFIHQILVEEPLVIDQLHRQTYPIEVVEMVVREVKSIQYSLNFLKQLIEMDFQGLTEYGFKVLG